MVLKLYPPKIYAVSEECTRDVVSRKAKEDAAREHLAGLETEYFTCSNGPIFKDATTQEP